MTTHWQLQYKVHIIHVLSNLCINKTQINRHTDRQVDPQTMWGSLISLLVAHQYLAIRFWPLDSLTGSLHLSIFSIEHVFMMVDNSHHDHYIMHLPWPVVPPWVSPVGDGSHVIWWFLHLISCESLRLLRVAGWGHGSVGIPRARCTVVKGTTLCGLGHAPHSGHHREGRGTLIPRHPSCTWVTTTHNEHKGNNLFKLLADYKITACLLHRQLPCNLHMFHWLSFPQKKKSWVETSVVGLLHQNKNSQYFFENMAVAFKK